MASRQIEYIWKVARPRNEAIARALMYAAYQTAIQTDPNTTQVLIRSYIHASTRSRGTYRKDDPHVTIAIKNPDTVKGDKHQASHGYTAHPRSFNILRVSPSGYMSHGTVNKEVRGIRYYNL
ncbi:hypothetical protein NOR_07277 [Metarhizium rileyi]|uniref:Uncharacterized protein n=1 Tax=Metarhizium rileyi (strain RCEF 4871) TaxID=1649241 RepID=A0A166YKF4_METRR|nr:hypothetical protein NOR_07277 [Metarhizium rileyi RCEF 4871]